MKGTLYILILFMGINASVQGQGNRGGGEELFVIVETMPVFPGCENKGSKSEVQNCSNTKMYNYILERTVYPDSMKESGIEGVVYIRFVVDTDGKITSVEIIRGMDEEAFNKEAIRVVTSLPKMTSGKQRGKPVKVQYTMPIKFELAKEKDRTTKKVK